MQWFSNLKYNDFEKNGDVMIGAVLPWKPRIFPLEQLKPCGDFHPRKQKNIWVSTEHQHFAE